MPEFRTVVRQAGSIQAAVFGLIAASPLLSAASTIWLTRGFTNDFIAVLTLVSSIAGFGSIAQTYFRVAPPPELDKEALLRHGKDLMRQGLTIPSAIAASAFAVYYYFATNGNPVAIVALAIASYTFFGLLTRVAIGLAIRTDSGKILGRMTEAELRRYRAGEAVRDSDVAFFGHPMPRGVAGSAFDAVTHWSAVSSIRSGRVKPIEVEGSDVRYYAVGDRRYVIAPEPLNAATMTEIVKALEHLKNRPTHSSESWLTLVITPEASPTDQALTLVEENDIELYREAFPGQASSGPRSRVRRSAQPKD